MTTTTQVPAVIDWLVAEAGNSPLLGKASPAVTVIDGPTKTADTLEQPLHLWVGGNPLQSEDSEIAEAVQSWPVLDHARTKDEDGSVVLVADAWGGGSMRAQRQACLAVVSAVELLLRGDGRTGPGDATMGGLVQWSAVEGPFSWAQRQTQSGAGCSCAFRVTYRARLITTGA